MATLSQLISGFSGVTGANNFEKQKKLYQLLGGKGNYVGDLNQNLFLLNNQNRWGQITQPASAPVPAPVPQDPYDILKQTALNNNLLKSEVDFESINPFSKYFDENIFRNAVKQGIQPEIDRVMGNLNANDASYRANELQNFNNNARALNQNYANQGAFFGGARMAKQNILSNNRQRSLDDYTRSFNNQRLEQERNFNRTIEDQLAAEKQKKMTGYQEEKTNYYKNPTYK